MAFIVSHPAPQPLIIEQPPPQPVYIQQPPPPPVYIQQPPPVIAAQPAAVVVQQNNPVVIQSPMKSISASTKCRFCQQQVVTLTKPVNGLLTWTIFGTLLVFCIWPFCLIPFCVKSCKDVKHTCPSCNNVIHVHKRM